MFGSLNTGLSGLRANQRYLDVIGNNIANSSTQGFKADRITFRDMFYQSIRQASGPSGNLGGVNAQQVGRGVRVGSIDAIFEEGSLTPTGREFDLALEGNGFFVLSDGANRFFTRAGSFDLDVDSNLVDTRTGLLVQNVNGDNVSLRAAATLPARATSTVSFNGNLPATGGDPVAEIQQSIVPFAQHLPATVASTLAASATVDLTGESITLTIDSASPVTLSFTATDFPTPLTLTQTAALINQKLAAANLTQSATAFIDPSGGLSIRSDSVGNSSLIEVTGGTTALTALGLDTSSQEQGSESAASSTTDLNDLSANTTDYTTGDVIQITGFDNGGTAVNISFTYGVDGRTMGDLMNRINSSGSFTDATLTLDGAGALTLTSSVTGDSAMAITIRDAASATNTNWSSHAFRVSQDGQDATPVATSIEVFDSLGIGHVLTGAFTRQDDGSWNLALSVPPAEGTVGGTPVTNIVFDRNGVFLGAGGGAITVTLANGANPLSIALGFTNPTSGSGITQTGNQATVLSDRQDGYEAGSLGSFEITQDGTIRGRYTNGVLVDIDNVAVASFANRSGLEKVGSTLFSETDNSGQPQVGAGGVAGRGAVRAGSLEGSNVDIAEEFVRLIEAQRAFQGNARVITTADEILNELVNLI